LPQYNDFQKNAYPYPAKPRDQWELGGGVGLGVIVGDRPLFVKNSLGGSYTGGVTGALSLRKSLGHVFSLRAEYEGSVISIPSYSTYVVYAKNETHMLSLDGIASLNTLSHYRGNPKTNMYLLAGYSLVYTRVRTYQNVGGTYGLHTLYYPTNQLIGTSGGVDNVSPGGYSRHAWALMHAVDFGAGWAFKLSDKFNLAVEQKFTVPVFGNDYLDGSKSGKSDDSYSYTTIRLNMNIGSKSTHVQPLWWINPNNYVYTELTTPKHLKILPILPDADGDGVTDQFDLEPNTPAGAAVDSHGRAKDTDGDGVPDYKDKEILTPQSCFPVNADGVGTCPEPACCKEIKDKLQEILDGGGLHPNKCNLSSLPSVSFKAGSFKLSKESQTILTSAATQIQANPTCNVKVVGYVTDASKKAQQLSWDRVNAVIKYLVEKSGVSESRIIFSYDTNGTSNSVDLIPTTETGPNTAPAPAPNFRSKK